MYERVFDPSPGLRTVLTSALYEISLNARPLDGPISLVGMVMARAFYSETLRGNARFGHGSPRSTVVHVHVRVCDFLFNCLQEV
jgi:hypothetical protein